MRSTPGAAIEVSWPAQAGNLALDTSRTLRASDWIPVAGQVQLEAGRFSIELSRDGTQAFFRLRPCGTIVFVDASNPTHGNGTLPNPFQGLPAAIEEAERCFKAGIPEVTVYVFTGSYSEPITMDGNGLGAVRLTVQDSSTTILHQGQAVGGAGPRAQLSATGAPPISVANLSGFSLLGFDVTSTDAPAISAQQIDRLVVSGFRLAAVNGAGLVATAIGGGSLNAISINGGTVGLRISSSTGDLTCSGVQIKNPSERGLWIDGGAGNVSFVSDRPDSNTIECTHPDATAILVQGGHTGTLILDAQTEVAVQRAQGIRLEVADGTYSFNGKISVEDGNDGIAITGGSGGRFTFADTTISSKAGLAFCVDELAAGATIDFTGNLTSEGGEGLISIASTADDTAIHFNRGEDRRFAATNTSGSGINLFDVSGTMDIAVPTTIDNAGFSAIFFGLCSGTCTFTDTTIVNQRTGNAGVDIIAEAGTIEFTNLDITTDTTDDFGRVGLLAQPGHVLNLFGKNTITANGGAAVSLQALVDFDITFDYLTSTNATFVGPTSQSGITVLDVGGADSRFRVTEKVTIANTGNDGIDIDAASGTFTFADIDIRDTARDGVSLGVVRGNTAEVTIASGSIRDTGGDGIRIGSTIEGSGGNLQLNRTAFTSIGGSTLNLTNSSVSGQGNTADSLAIKEGGGNTGTIEINGRQVP